MTVASSEIVSYKSAEASCLSLDSLHNDLLSMIFYRSTCPSLLRLSQTSSGFHQKLTNPIQELKQFKVAGETEWNKFLIQYDQTKEAERLFKAGLFLQVKVVIRRCLGRCSPLNPSRSPSDIRKANGRVLCAYLDYKKNVQTQTLAEMCAFTSINPLK